MKSLVLLFALVVATKLNSEGNEEKLHQNANAPMLVKIEEDEYAKKIKNSSHYIGVSYNQLHKKWSANRRSKLGKKLIHNGYYKDEDTAAHASDNLARKLMRSGEKKHRLNFPSDDIEALPEKITSSKFIGVSYNEPKGRWQVYRYSKNGKKMVHNGCYKSEETAAHASDTSARKLMKNGEQQLKLNFPYDENEVRPEKTKTSSKFIGVSYNEPKGKWRASRYSKIEKKLVYNGHYKDEKTATHASDTLARKLMKNGEKNHKLNIWYIFAVSPTILKGHMEVHAE
jgi:hypothetical protein